MKIEIKYVPGKRPYHIDVQWRTTKDWSSSKAYTWCMKTFGHRNEKYDNPRWYGNTRYFTGDFQFRDKKDAEWFLLRWL